MWDHRAPLRPNVLRYSSAFAATALAYLLHRALERYLGVEDAPFLTFYPAMILVTVLAGFWPGVLTTLLSALVADYVFSPPYGSLFRYDKPGDAYAEAAFVISGIFLSIVAERFRRNQLAIGRLEREMEVRALQDTARELTEYKELALQSAGFGVWAISPTGTVSLDQQARALLGLPRQGTVSPADLFSKVQADHRNGLAETAKYPAGEYDRPLHSEVRIPKADGSNCWVSLDYRLVPVQDGDNTKGLRQVGLVCDITRRKAAELRIKQLVRIYAVISDVNQTIVRERDSKKMIQTICRIAVNRGLFRMAWIGLVDRGTHRLRIAASDGYPDGYLAVSGIDYLDPELADRPAVRSFLADDHVICNDIEQEPEYLLWRSEALRREYRSVSSFPLRIDGQVVGVFSMYSAEPAVFDEEEIRVLDEMAMDISFSLKVHQQDEEKQKTETALREAHERLALATRAGGVGIWDLDVVNNRLTWDDQMFRLYGVAKDSFSGAVEAWFAGVHPDDREWAMEANKAALSGERDFNSEFRIVWPDQSVHYIRGLATVQRDAEGCARRMIGTNWDITPLRESDRALITTERRYQTVFETSLDAICMIELESGNYAEVNSAFLAMTGFARDEVIGRTSAEFDLFSNPQDRDTMHELVHENAIVRDREMLLKRRDGSTFWATITVSTIVLNKKRFVHAVIRDVSEAKLAEEEIKNLAFFDQLTGLANRRLLIEHLERVVASNARPCCQHAVLFMDLDNFKILNDSHGHQTGDKLLQEVAKRLMATVLKSDFVGRLGGDEFIFIASDLDQNPESAAAQAEAIAAKLRKVICSPYLIDGLEFHSSCSIGVTLFGSEAVSANEVLQQGDIAMYQAKAAGRNVVRFFASELQSVVNARASLEHEIRRGIQQKEFILHYQPQVRGGRVVGCEALLRWQEPKRGLLGPAHFIQMAEESRLILPLGAWVIEEACRQLAKWASCESMSSLEVAINISALQFRSRDFVEEILHALSSFGVPAGKLKIELTESMLVEDVEGVIEKMKILKAHGIKIALDDFGTGYSSLSYLNRLPLDQLKIDFSFVRNICSDATSATIAQTIISLGKTMGLSVIAEGVENPNQQEFLAKLGCDIYQGYLFAPALEPEVLEQRVPSIELVGSESV